MEEGRASIDAVILALLLGTVVALGMTPVGIDESAGADIIAVSVTLAVVAAVISILKGKFYMGILGLFIPPLAYIAAIRLARPRSMWARWRYTNNEKKMAKALARDVKREARKTRVRDLLGGTPHLKSPQA
jgi:lysyl-tRNA synthetase class 2